MKKVISLLTIILIANALASPIDSMQGTWIAYKSATNPLAGGDRTHTLKIVEDSFYIAIEGFTDALDANHGSHYFNYAKGTMSDSTSHLFFTGIYVDSTYRKKLRKRSNVHYKCFRGDATFELSWNATKTELTLYQIMDTIRFTIGPFKKISSNANEVKSVKIEAETPVT